MTVSALLFVVGLVLLIVGVRKRHASADRAGMAHIGAGAVLMLIPVGLLVAGALQLAGVL